NTSNGCVYRGFGSIDLQSAHRTDSSARATVSRVENPGHPCGERCVGDTHMLSQIVQRLWRSVSRKIGRAAAYDATNFANLGRNERTIRQRPHPNAQIDVLINQVKRMIRQGQIDIYLRKLSQERAHDRDDMKPAEDDRRRDLKTTAWNIMLS